MNVIRNIEFVMPAALLYPPSPANVPAELLAPVRRSGIQILLVLCVLALFILLYFGLMIACILFVVWAIFLCPHEPGNWLYVKSAVLMATPFAGFTFLVLVKNLFKTRRASTDDALEIRASEHPKLFDFIDRLCGELGAPRPHRVYVDGRVNAYVKPESATFFHLILPTQRSLVIGLGLVNLINLSEFKAMLAHEFGHFGQSSLRLSVYVASALQICIHMIDGEDALDRMILAWSRMDPAFGWPALLLRADMWCVRQLLRAMAIVIYRSNNALKRQSEFDADLAAVRAAGSDALTHLLKRCHLAQASMRQTLSDLGVAADSRLYTKDLFHHQSAAVETVRRMSKDPRLADPPPLPEDVAATTQVFADNDELAGDAWEDHPSYFERECRAKAHYVRTDLDERSAWRLFDNAAELRERVTFNFYRYDFKLSKDILRTDAQEVQGFIDEEHADRVYHAKYHGLYDGRNLILRDLDELARDAVGQPWSIAELARTHAVLYDADVKERAQLYATHMDEFNRLVAIQNGWQRPKTNAFEFRGETWPLADVRRLLANVQEEIEADNRWLEEQDRRVFMTYLQMAQLISPDVATELLRRYEFHRELQKIWFELSKQERPLRAAIQFVNTRLTSQLQTSDFDDVLKIWRDAHQTMGALLKTSEALMLPPLRNLPLGQPLRPFLLEKDLVGALSKYEQGVSDRWVKRLLDQFGEMKSNVDRMHHKSLAGILALQEHIGSECEKRWASLAV